jgi:Na+/H+ antiporter NhaC
MGMPEVMVTTIIKELSNNNFPILLALLSVFCVAYMDVGQGREQGAEAFQQELHNAAMRPLLRLEYEQHCCALSGKLLMDNS